MAADFFFCVFVGREGRNLFPYPLCTLSLTVFKMLVCFCLIVFVVFLYLSVRISGLKKLVPSGKFYSIFLC